MSNIHFREVGTGQPLVLLHGFCETGRIWDDLVNELLPKFRVLNADLPGFGQSPLPPAGFGLSQIASLVWQALDEMNITRPVVIGHSLGGYITLAMAEARPDDLAGIGLFHSTAFSDPEEKRQNRNKTIAFVQRYGVAAFAETFVPALFYQKDNPHIGSVLAMVKQTTIETLVAYTVAMRDRPQRTEVLESFPAPILIVGGEQDTLVPKDDLVAQSKRIPFLTFRSLTSVGHMGFYEAEEKALQAIEEFMLIVSNGEA